MFRRDGFLLSTLIGGVHIAVGLAILAVPSASNVTPFHLTCQFAAALTGGYLPENVAGGIAFVIVGILALFPRFAPDVRVSAYLLVPQQLTLMLQLASVNIAVFNGQYPDGYIPFGTRGFIFADQAWAVFACIVQGVELSDLVARGWGARFPWLQRETSGG